KTVGQNINPDVLDFKQKLLDMFFFSSRRRHTRLQGDWSSDVCSSDLEPAGHAARRVILFLEIDSEGKEILVFFQLLRGANVDEKDRKSTRLNSSHLVISYAVFCLKKKSTYDAQMKYT